MAARNIIVVGASAGGVEALSNLARGLPADLQAAVFVVLHTSAEGPGMLPDILGRRSSLPVSTAVDNAPIENGHIYVGRPDRHLLLEPGRMCLGRGPTENRHRPAIDPLFRSAAYAYGEKVIGVLLSGYLDDGVAGLIAIKERGGLSVVQSPEDALVSGMPLAAIENDHVDYSVPVAEMAELLADLAMGKKKSKQTVTPGLSEQDRVSVYTCPECHGTLWEVDEQGLLQFRCRVGHKLSRDSMLDAQAQSLERALWAALRSLEEHAELSRRLAARAKTNNQDMAARLFEERWQASAANAKVIRDMLTESGATAPEDERPAQPQPMPAEEGDVNYG